MMAVALSQPEAEEWAEGCCRLFLAMAESGASEDARLIASALLLLTEQLGKAVGVAEAWATHEGAI
jgi:hypothetical protein